MQNKVKRGRPRKNSVVKNVGRGRPKKVVEIKNFDPSVIQIKKGGELNFNPSLFNPIKTSRELDTILSTEGGLMPATNMILVGGPGAGKSTVALDMVADFTSQGKKCLFVSGEMDEIGYYKYCKRFPKFNCIEVLFLKNHANEVKEVVEHVFKQGWDVVVVDSIAEVIEMYKDQNGVTMGKAESWFLNIQDKMKLGQNEAKKYTSFINIQQVTKDGTFAGSNRLKHMTDAMCHIEVSKDRGERNLYFSKNRDCDKVDYKVFFSFYNGEVFYQYEIIN